MILMWLGWKFNWDLLEGRCGSGCRHKSTRSAKRSQTSQKTSLVLACDQVTHGINMGCCKDEVSITLVPSTISQWNFSIGSWIFAENKLCTKQKLSARYSSQMRYPWNTSVRSKISQLFGTWLPEDDSYLFWWPLGFSSSAVVRSPLPLET